MRGDLLITAAHLRRCGIQAKVLHDLRPHDDIEFDQQCAARIAEGLKDALGVFVRQYAITAASRQQLRVWIQREIEGAANSLQLPKELERSLELEMLAQVNEIVAEGDPGWPLVRTGKEIKNLHQQRMTLGIVELLRSAYEVYARIVIGERLRRRPLRGIWG